ncbi:MAG: LPS assembly protein LptD [Silicimonas sp.]|nr:LPS assembly protein LptD [Silicimonas sp.]
MRAALLALILALLAAFPRPSVAQDLASLIADSIAVDPAGRIVATGNVEVFYQGTRLTARQVTYSRNGDRLTISGPIRITDTDGSLLLADEAQLDRDLRNGVLVSARLVLDQQLQLAANEIARVDARYTRLDRVVASSCEVCAKNPVPFWEIRASRVIHDDHRRQLYFEDAQFRVAGVPVFYFPRMRIPDPSVERYTGFLIPQISSSSELGTGIKIPYFVTLGDHADITLTPYLTSSTQTLEFDYRHLFRDGRIAAIGAMSHDDVRDTRGYFFGTGEFQLARGYTMTGQLEFVSDPAYLFEYGYSEKDRLTNRLAFSRVRERDRFRASVSKFRTLRESEIPISDTLPDQFVEFQYLREIPDLSFGGKTTAQIGLYALERTSSADILGRDVSRISAEINWKRAWTFSPGILASTEVGLRTDGYSIAQDSNFAGSLTRTVPRAAAELRWPFSRRTRDGGTEVLEPIVRIDISDTGGDPVPLEDSRVVEFDEANLFSPTRYPGFDGAEDGLRVAVGASWQRTDPDGWVLDMALGRVANLTGDLGFGEGSGLEGDRSEWMLSSRLTLGDKLQVISRSLFDSDIRFTLSETRLDWKGERARFGTNYLFAVPEPSEDRTERLEEWSFDGAYEIDDRWTAMANWRYDFNANRATRTGIGLGYRSECVDLSLSVSRRFADSTSVDPTTEFGFRVSLTGIGGRGNDTTRLRRCRG